MKISVKVLKNGLLNDLYCADCNTLIRANVPDKSIVWAAVKGCSCQRKVA